MAADKVHLHLELLPMLVGFFTYKIAIVGRQSLQVFRNALEEIKK